MGYEVMDAGRAREPQSGTSGYGPVDVIALEDLPDLSTDPGGVRPPRIPPWLRRAAARVSPVLAIVLVSAMTVGGLAGAWYAHRRAVAAQEAGARAAASAFALAVGIDSYDDGSGQAANVSVRVFNVGTRPLKVAGAKGLGALADTGVRVTVITGDGVVRPGRDELVRVRVPLRCDDLTSRLDLSVPVRSEDGTLHEVVVRDTDQGLLSQTPQDLCAQASPTDPMSVRVTGSLNAPVLEIVNTSDKPVTVSLDSGSPLTETASEFLAVTTRPALPTTVPAGATRRLALRLNVQGCHRDLGPLTDGSVGYFGLRLEGAGAVTQMGVDVNALVGAALERSCR